MIRILAVGDLHCYQQSYERAAKGAVPDRLLEWEAVADALVDLAAGCSPQFIVFPGDLFINSRPEPTAIAHVLELFSRLEELGARVIACSGNHDWLGPNQQSIVDVLRHWNPLWGITRPTALAMDDWPIGIAVMPWQRQQDMDGAPDELARDLADILSTRAPGKPRMLVGHWAIQGATYCTGVLSDEPAVSTAVACECGYSACVMGHIHKPQVLSDDPLALHTGTFTRAKIDEGRVPCGAYLIDMGSAGRTSYVFHELPARPIVTLDLTQAALVGSDEDAVLAEIGDVSGAIVVPRCELADGVAPALSAERLAELIEQAGAHHIAPLRVSVARAVRGRAAEVDAELAPMSAFTAWCKANDVEHGRAARAGAVLKEILAEIGA